MNINYDILKKPMAWSIIVPGVLLIWMLISLSGMVYSKDNWRRSQTSLEKTLGYKKEILSLLKKSGTDTPTASIQNYDGLDSALVCADYAEIDNASIKRKQTSAPKQERGSDRWLYHESYDLSSVKLLQIAKFIDYAERNFSSLYCKKLDIRPASDNKKNSWDAAITFHYFKQDKEQL